MVAVVNGGLIGRGGCPPCGESEPPRPVNPPSDLDERGTSDAPTAGVVAAPPRSSSSTVREMEPSVILTAEHRETGEVVVVIGHGEAGRGPVGARWILRGRIVGRYKTEGRTYGKIASAVRDAVLQLEKKPGPWRVLSISYPNTILIDLRGGWRRNGGAMQLPEPRLLGAIGRPDLWDPRGS